MAYTTILYEEPEPGLGVLTLNRPDRLNALTNALVEEIHDCLDMLDRKIETRVLILTGAGRAFCAGADLKSGLDETKDNGLGTVPEACLHQRRIADVILRLRKIPQPVIAAVNGVAAGGGFSISMAADIRIADASARFIASYANIGLSAGEMGSSYFMPRYIGLSRAAEILYTGRFVGAEEATQIGFVSRVVPVGEAVTAAVELARVMLSKSPFGLRMTKEVLNQNIDAQSLESALYLENRTQTLGTRTDDFAEAVRAFVEKRPPKYTGS